MDTVRIFSHSGYLIEQIRTSVNRTWTLIAESSAVFSLSVYDEKCNPYVLNYGNLVLIEQSDGLPAWVGMIDKIEFTQGACIVTAFTLERYFNYRRGPRTATITGTAGIIFSELIKYINGQRQTVLAVGSITSNTNVMQETLNPTPLTDNLTRIIQRSGEGYRWRPQVDKGELIVYADWFSDLMLETGLILQDGYNISGEHPLTLSAPMNDYMAYGTGNDWEKRIVSTAQDEESIQLYGLRQSSVSVNTVSVDTINVTAKTLLDQNKQPMYSFPISALNKDDTFKKLIPGALATFTKLVGQGFSNSGLGYLSYSMIIKTMQYDPSNGIVSLAF